MCFIKRLWKKFDKVESGPKTMHIGLSLLFTMPIENLKISFTFTIFYVVGFLKLTAMMIEVAYVIPWVLSRIKAEDL